MFVAELNWRRPSDWMSVESAARMWIKLSKLCSSRGRMFITSGAHTHTHIAHLITHWLTHAMSCFHWRLPTQYDPLDSPSQIFFFLKNYAFINFRLVVHQKYKFCQSCIFCAQSHFKHISTIYFTKKIRIQVISSRSCSLKKSEKIQ